MLRHAELDWDEAGRPRSRQFQDPYFSSTDGLAETRYVFLHHNHLAQRWQQPPHQPFTVLETGFGSGLNFLATWAAWEQADALCRLHFISIEKYPLRRADLQRALALWPMLRIPAEALLAAYPPALPGPHRLIFAEGRLILDLWFGDVLEVLDALAAPAEGVVDAWFLDGFAPAKNPAMWQPELFLAMARLSRAKARFSTFTAAGEVRRGLLAAGFRVEKVAGFGRKRDMLCGDWPAAAARSTSLQEPWFAPPAPLSVGAALLIGGGLAGTATALSLSRRGWHCTLLEAEGELAAAASGNRQGLLYPPLSADVNDLPTRFYLAATSYASRHARAFSAVAQAACGVLQLARDAREQARLEKIAALGLDTDFVHWADAARASRLSGYPLQQGGLFFPAAGWVAPAELCAAQWDASAGDLHLHRRVARLRRADNGDWQALAADGTLLGQAPVLVLANAHAARALLPAAAWPLRVLRGQVTHARATPHPPLACALCYEGYIAPPHEGRYCFGASYAPDDRRVDLRAADDAANLELLRRVQPGLAAGLQLDGARAGLRCSSADHLPLVGGVADYSCLREVYADLCHGRAARHYPTPPYQTGLYVNIAHGSRGLTSIPLAAELLAAQIGGEAAPLPQTLCNALNPQRFVLRELKKARPGL